MAQLAMITARVNPKVKSIVMRWCKSRGIVMAKFIEDALLDKLEECHDLEEIDALRREPVRPFRDLLKELTKD
ncbi:MAG: hypothetical protein EBZ48_11340 [Proteobacteria bacterium]|nr:hypothetical protein [Pseudomonadota bacterium]